MHIRESAGECTKLLGFVAINYSDNLLFRYFRDRYPSGLAILDASATRAGVEGNPRRGVQIVRAGFAMLWTPGDVNTKR